MQRLRTGFSTLMLALSMQTAAVVSAQGDTSAAEPNAWGFSDADSFVFAGSVERQAQASFETEYAAPEQWPVQSGWVPASEDANAHIFMLLKHVGAIDSDTAHHDFLLI